MYFSDHVVTLRQSRSHCRTAIRTMKLTFILLFVACLQASGEMYSQTVSLDLQNASLEQAFREIRKQSGFRFIYVRSELQQAGTVSLKVRQIPVSSALELCLRGKALEFTMEDRYIIIRSQSSPSVNNPTVPVTRDIRGRLRHSGGEPVANATVTAKKSGQQTQTDSDGQFALSGIADDDILIFSSVEIETLEVRVSGQSFIEVQARTRVNELEETIIKGYYNTIRRLNTGTVSKVNASIIEQQPVSNPIAALQGRVPGLLITQSNGYNGSGFSILLRGQQSLLQGTDPFILIDGVPAINGNTGINQLNNAGFQLSPLNSLNPADIESIEVLKDADATALYGSRGANGVILISTKKGKAGKTSVQFNLYSGTSRVTRSMDILDTRGYLQMRREAFANDQLTPTAANAPDLLVFDTTAYTDFQRLLIGGRARTLQADLGVSGGNEMTQFRVNTGYHRETTVLPTDLANDRISLSSMITHSGKKRNLRIQLSSSYSLNRNRLPSQDMAQHILLPPHLRLYDSAGNLNWKEGALTFRSLQVTNPLAQLNARYQGDFQSFHSNLNLQLSLLKGLEFKFSGGFNSLSGAEVRINPSTAIDPAFTSTLPNSGFSQSQRRGWIAEPQLGYQRSSGKHTMGLMAGASFQESLSSALNLTASNYSSDLLLWTVAGAGTVVSDNPQTQYRYMGVYGRIHYQYDEKYLINLTGRRDGSSRFGPGRQFANFGAAGLGWIFSREGFFTSLLPVISYGKIRVSYGITGNDQIGDYQYLDTWTTNPATYQGQSILSPSRLYNPDYSWEENRKMELGLELGFIRDRILVNLQYFRNRSGNQLINYSLPSQAGFGFINRNLPALIQNTGLEIEVNSRNIIQKRFGWQTQFHITLPRNKILDFPGLANSSYANTYIIGKSVSARMRYAYTGVDPQTGVYSFTDANRDGLMNQQDRIVAVSTDPVFFGGLNNTVRAGSFTAAVFFEYRKQTGRNYLAGLNVPGYRYVNAPALILNRWTQPGDQRPVQGYTTVTSSAAYQAAANLLGNSDGIFSDASFIRCKTLSLNWDLPAKWIQRIKASQAGLYIQAQNLFVITGYQGADPENQSLLLLPPLRTLSAGIKLTL